MKAWSQSGVPSSLKRSHGYASSRRAAGSKLGGVPRRSETTKGVGGSPRPGTPAGGPAGDGLEAGRVPQPQRDHEVDGRLLAAEHLGEWAAGLAQGEVERCALHRPAPVVAEGRHLRRAAREQLELADVAGEGAEGPLARGRPRGAAPPPPPPPPRGGGGVP